MSIFADIKAVGAAIIAVLATLAIYSLVNTIWLLPRAREQGRSTYIAEQAIKDQRAELERKGDDAKLQRMSDYDLCVSAIGSVPDCDVFKLQPIRQE